MTERVTRKLVDVSVVRGGGALRLCSWRAQDEEGRRVPDIDGQPLVARVGGTGTGRARALCVTPGEWLLVGSTAAISDLYEQFRSPLRSQGFVLTDVTSAFSVFQLRGLRTRHLLSKGCGIDFHERSFGPGQCARTRFAQVALIIDCVDAVNTFTLYLEHSYADYLAEFLDDASADMAIMT